MVFSLFGRKDKTDARRPRATTPARAPDNGARGPTAQPSVAEQRELARRTAEKIDRIESEMIDGPASTRPMQRSAVQPGALPGAVAPAAAKPGAAPRPAPGLEPARTAQPMEPLDFGTSMVLGDSGGFGGIQVSGSSLPADLEEAAILFANGQAQAAAVTLRAATARGGPEASARQAWAMLFDVLQACGSKADFEVAAIEYAARFEKSPPPWIDSKPEHSGPRRTMAPSVITFPAMLDQGIARQVEAAQRSTVSKRPVTIDLGAVAGIDAEGAALFVGMVKAFEKSGRELSVIGARTLYDTARARIEPGRRDDNDSCWQAALLGLRLLGERQAFDDLSIDFCVTYEVSPPSWEPMPPSIRAGSSGESAPAPVQAEPGEDASHVGVVEGGAFAFQGEIVGRMAAELAAFRKYAADRHDIVVDCRGMRRLDFLAAGELLNEIVAQVGAGKTVLFVEPSAIVDALMTVMGIHELADIRRRKI